jgi:hypothetical protein
MDLPDYRSGSIRARLSVSVRVGLEEKEQK